jgi:protein ImuA
MTTHILTRRGHRPKPGLPFLGDLCLAPARVHEFCGPARRTLALIAARRIEGPVFWISPGWLWDRLHGDGVAEIIPPGRLTFVTPRRAEDLLWSMEEVLRAGCVPLVICEVPGIPHLTPVRRLHLAAETAAREHGTTPLGLLLIPGAGGAPGVESRWHMKPAHSGHDQHWQLERRRARMDPLASWQISRTGGEYVAKGETVVA